MLRERTICKMKKKWLEKLKDWDEGRFDLTNETALPTTQRPAENTEHAAWQKSYLSSLENRERSMFLHFYPIAAVLLTVCMIAFLLMTVEALPAFGSADTPANRSETILRYTEKGMEETGAVNIVAGIILDYRAFDTLGESHVLFTAASAVFILLLKKKKEKESEHDAKILTADPVLQATARILVPVVVLFGFYIMFNGHIGPGGGFCGGAVLGAALILTSLSFGTDRLSQILTLRTYRITVCSALFFYSFSKCYSFFCGANGLHTIFSPGTPGRIFSAGLILPLTLAVGIVVACTMYGFFALFSESSL